MSKCKEYVPGKRDPFVTNVGIQIRNPVAMGQIVMSTMEEKEEERMPNFDVKAFVSTHKKQGKTRAEYLAERRNHDWPQVKTVNDDVPKIKKKSLLYRVVQSVSKVLLMMFPEDKLDKSKYKKDENND